MPRDANNQEAEELQLLRKSVDLLEKIEQYLRPKNIASRIEIVVTLPNGKKQTGGSMVDVAIGQQYDVDVKDELTASGQVIVPTVQFGFTLSDPTLGTLTVKASGMGCTYVPKIAGTGTITVTDPSTPSCAPAVSNFTTPPLVPATIEITESAPIPAV
jgi:hypothetical protein